MEKNRKKISSIIFFLSFLLVSPKKEIAFLIQEHEFPKDLLHDLYHPVKLIGSLRPDVICLYNSDMMELRHLIGGTDYKRVLDVVTVLGIAKGFTIRLEYCVTNVRVSLYGWS